MRGRRVSKVIFDALSVNHKEICLFCGFLIILVKNRKLAPKIAISLSSAPLFFIKPRYDEGGQTFSEVTFCARSDSRKHVY